MITERQIVIKTLCEGLRFPEGPAFTADGSLWAVELKGETIVRYKEGELQKISVGGMPNGIAIDKRQRIWFCDAGGNSIRLLSPDTESIIDVVTHVNGNILARPNDLAFDQKGNLVFTCPGESRVEPTGYVCVLTTNGEVKKVLEGKRFPNGLAFTEDGKRLIIAETYNHRLWIGDWDQENCELKNETVWCEVGGPRGPGGPDGMAFHANGCLYVAVYGTSQIRVIDTNGVVIGKIDLPGECPTNCAFDVHGKLELIVTEAETGALLSISDH